MVYGLLLTISSPLSSVHGPLTLGLGGGAIVSRTVTRYGRPSAKGDLRFLIERLRPRFNNLAGVNVTFLYGFVGKREMSQ